MSIAQTIRPSLSVSCGIQVPLFVILFEAITSGKLDFDYAPCSMLISHGTKSKRQWVNISQEGKSAVDDLREKNCVNAIKVRLAIIMVPYILLINLQPPSS